MATNRKCTVLALTKESSNAPGGPDPAELLAVANAHWGARSAARRLSHIVHWKDDPHIFSYLPAKLNLDGLR
eukprot:2619170-Pyramimonas_sp.AAC.2